MQTIRLRFSIGLLRSSAVHPRTSYISIASGTRPFWGGPAAGGARGQRRWQSVPAQEQGAGAQEGEGSKHPESSGLTTPAPEGANTRNPKTPFYFEAGYAVFAKRRSRPFPPPFVSIPSG